MMKILLVLLLVVSGCSSTNHIKSIEHEKQHELKITDSKGNEIIASMSASVFQQSLQEMLFENAFIRHTEYDKPDSVGGHQNVKSVTDIQYQKSSLTQNQGAKKDSTLTKTERMLENKTQTESASDVSSKVDEKHIREPPFKSWWWGVALVVLFLVFYYYRKIK